MPFVLVMDLTPGNDLSTPRPGFAGLKPGCRWCLCVARCVRASSDTDESWKEAFLASERLGEQIVPR